MESFSYDYLSLYQDKRKLLTHYSDELWQIRIKTKKNNNAFIENKKKIQEFFILWCKVVRNHAKVWPLYSLINMISCTIQITRFLQ